MSNFILRPYNVGAYSDWAAVPGTIWAAIDDVIADGDASYAHSNTAGEAFTVPVQDIDAGAGMFTSSWPRAVRIPSVRIVGTMRTTGGSADYRFRLRYLGTNYDSDIITCTSGAYIEQDWRLNWLPDHRNHAWNVPRLNDLEVGLVYESGVELRCTKLEIFVHIETYPYYTLIADGAGNYAQWSNYPGVAPPYLSLQRFDGDLSYLYSAPVGIGDISSFNIDNLGTLVPPNIDRVQTKALVKNTGTVAEVADVLVRSGGNDYFGATHNLGYTIPPDEKWYLIGDEYLNNPDSAWPSGNPVAIAWNAAQVDGMELGFRNKGGGDFRCTSLAAEVWLAPTYPTTINYYPINNGSYTDFPPIVPGAGEAAWEDVDEVPPDDAASYIEADATAAGTPQYCSFEVGGAGVIPAGERIYNVELRCRVRLGGLPHSTTVIAPVIVWGRFADVLYVGKPVTIEDTGATWFDVKWDFPVDVQDGQPWPNTMTVFGYDWGLAVLEGDVLLSRVRVQVQTCIDYRDVAIDAVDLQVTNVGNAMIARSILDGTIYAVTEFSVGVGGYPIGDPGTVTPVNLADTTLSSEVYRGRVGFVDWVVDPDWEVQYYCRVPRDEAYGGLGELGLWAEILWSPFPAEIGTFFLFALGHFPCQTKYVDRDVHLYVPQINYP